jgi:hypothetical protein
MRLPGFDSEAGGGRAAVDQVGPVLELLELAFDDADQAVQVAAAKLAMDRLVSDKMPSTGLMSGVYAGQPVDPQPGLILLGEVRQLRRQVNVEVIPDPDQRG